MERKTLVVGVAQMLEGLSPKYMIINANNA